MNIKSNIILIILLSFYVLSYAQNVRKLIKEGDTQFNKGNYYGAINAYNRVIRENKIPLVVYKCAEANRLNFNFEEAERWYAYVIKKDEHNYPLARFWLGDVYKSTGEYQKAQYQFSNFLRNVKKNSIKVDDFYILKAKHELIACEKAFYYKLEPEGVVINHLDTNINTVYSEFGITKMFDSLFVYGSFRYDPIDTEYFVARIYQSLVKDELFQKGRLLDTLINKPGFHATNPSFSNKQSMLYYCLTPKDGSRESKIYRSKFSEGRFQLPELLPQEINKPGTMTLQPNITELGDKEYLIFTSNRKDGFGGYDIWFSEVKDDNSFGEVFNMGCNLNQYKKSDWHYIKKESDINSIEDEITPYYNPFDSCLYFSSKWHNSMGGFDIFKVKGDFVKWDSVENLGYPINSNYNEVYYFVDAKGGKAYYSSNRSGSLSYNNDHCCNDIYEYSIPKYIDRKEIEDNKITVMEQEIKLLVPLTLYFHNDIPNPNTMDTTTDLSYETTYFSYLKLIDEYKADYSKGLKKKDKYEAEEKIEDFFENEIKRGYRNLTKFCLLMEKLLAKGETIEITIKGFASPLHASDYNVNLSKRRIQSLVNYLSVYNNGIFLPYINGTSELGNQLIFKREAFGEDTADKTVSDDASDLVHSVYSPEAAYERKIKVIAISMDRKK